VDIDHFCAPVVHPVKEETIPKYKTLVNDPVTREIWSRAFGKEFGNFAQGDDLMGTAGTDSFFCSLETKSGIFPLIVLLLISALLLISDHRRRIPIKSESQLEAT